MTVPPEWCPPDDAGEPYHECLWRVEGVDLGRRRLIGLVRAPDRGTALVLALQKYRGYLDLKICGEPIIDRHYVKRD